MASDYLLEIDGIKGESEDLDHPGAIELLSWSFGASNPTRRRGGKVSFQDFHFSAYSTSASPTLFQFLRESANHPIKLATLYARKAGTDKQEDYFVIKLTDCLVSSFAMGSLENGFMSPAFPGPGMPPSTDSIDSVSMKVSGYDVKANKKV